jgi:hypothetical protein
VDRIFWLGTSNAEPWRLSCGSQVLVLGAYLTSQPGTMVYVYPMTSQRRYIIGRLTPQSRPERLNDFLSSATTSARGLIPGLFLCL